MRTMKFHWQKELRFLENGLLHDKENRKIMFSEGIPYLSDMC